MVDVLLKLRRALSRARLDFAAVVQKARDGEVQIIEVPGAVAITALCTSGPFKTCQIVAVAGDLSRMAELDAKVTAWARSNGCQAIETEARRGWSRIAPPAPGYEPIAIKYRKTLEG